MLICNLIINRYFWPIFSHLFSIFLIATVLVPPDLGEKIKKLKKVFE